MGHLDLAHLVGPLVIVTALIILFGSRLTPGSAKETPDGLIFPLRPLFLLTRTVLLPAYLGFFLWFGWQQTHTISWALLLFGVIALALGALQLPGTITLTPTAITQRYWLRPLRTIPYSEITQLQQMIASRSILVVGANNVRIRHSSNHAASQQFQSEIERRTGMRVIR